MLYHLLCSIVCFYILFNYVAPSLPVSWLANLVSPRYRPNYMFSAKEGVTCENRPRVRYITLFFHVLMLTILLMAIVVWRIDPSGNE